MSDTTNNEERNIQDEQKIDQNLKEIISKASKNRELTKDEIKALELKFQKISMLFLQMEMNNLYMIMENFS